MVSWMLFLIFSLCIYLLFGLLFPSNSSRKKYLPGPTTLSFISNILLFRKLSSGIRPIIRHLISRYGPIVALRMGSFQVVLISSHSIAHQALVKRARAFSGRPNNLESSKILNKGDQHEIGGATYGATWRLLHGNLTMGILKPSNVNCYSKARAEVLQMLTDRLLQESTSGAVTLKNHLQNALTSLAVLMCLGKKLEEKKIDEIVTLVDQLMLILPRCFVIDLFPRLGKILFPGRLRDLKQMHQHQEDVIIPLIRSRIKYLEKRGLDDGHDLVMAYVDTLINLELPDKKRILNEVEMASLCVEFLVAATETTIITLEWIMASLVKYPFVQDKLYKEIRQMVGTEDKMVINDKDLQRMPYLKAVVLEGLRCHPPVQFGVPRTTTEDTELEGYVIPNNTTVAFLIADMGMDASVWEEPTEFKPERFLASSTMSLQFDVTGSTDIRMIPFGAGRRMCPAYELALLHLEFFVANLVWCFEWTSPPNHVVDLSEKVQFTTSMKNPLRVHLSPR